MLTDQSVLAGVGNAYSDEALHLARMSPFKPAAKLTDDEVERLYRGARRSARATPSNGRPACRPPA